MGISLMDMEMVREYSIAQGAEDAVVTTHWTDGGDGSGKLAEAVVAAAHRSEQLGGSSGSASS